MSTTPSDAERVARLAAELAELGRRMAWARYELLALSVAAPVPMPAGPEPAPPAPHPAWPQPALELAEFEPAAPEPAESEPVRSVPSKADERQRSGQLLPWAGGAITLVGIVMLLVLAASQGWFGVPARLVAGAVLGLALVAVAHRVHRRADSPAGALALAGTGIAALYLDVATATARYHYLPDAVGLLLGLVVAGAGLALADRWRAEPLGCASVLGVGVLLPALYGDSLPLLVALALVPQLAAAPVVLRRGWTGLALVSAFFPVLYGSIAVFGAILTESLAGSTNSAPTVTAVAAVFLVGLVLAVLGSNRLHPVAAAARLAAASVPVLAMATVYPDRRGALLAGLVGLAALAVAAPLGRLPLPRPLPLSRPLPQPHPLARATAATVGAVAIFEATVLLFGGAAAHRPAPHGQDSRRASAPVSPCGAPHRAPARTIALRCGTARRGPAAASFGTEMRQRSLQQRFRGSRRQRPAWPPKTSAVVRQIWLMTFGKGQVYQPVGPATDCGSKGRLRVKLRTH